jgi:ABC-type polysaccharide/polyol phosphate transport system ATPase subunit
MSKRYVLGRRESRFGRLFRRRALEEGVGGVADDDVEDDDDTGDDDGGGDEDLGTVQGGGEELREIWALRDVSFAMKPGSALALVGPHGSGKTTLMKILARLSMPTEGRAVIRGRVAPLIQGGGGIVRPDASGRKNARQVAQFYGIPRDLVDDRLEQILDLAGLSSVGDIPVGSHSSVALKRLPLATVLHCDPDILLLEEDAFGADADFRERCLDTIDELRADGLTMLVVAHDEDIVRRHCSEALYLKAGSVVSHGDVDAVMKEYAPPPAAKSSADPPQRRSGFNAHAAILSGSARGAPATLPAAEPVSLSMQIEVAARRAQVTPGVVLLRGASRVVLRPPGPFVAEHGGLYDVTVTLPKGLQGGTYLAQLGALVVVEGQEGRLLRPDAFSFEVAMGGQETPEKPSSRWRVEYEGEPVEFEREEA